MAVLQTAYVENLVAGYAGMVANGETSNRITRTCEDAAGIGFGVPVYSAAGDHGCTRTPNANFLGITIANTVLGYNVGDDVDEYQQYDNVTIVTQGVIWVPAGEAVTDGAAAYDTDTEIVDTSTDNTALTGWKFDTTGADGDIVKLAKR